MINCLVIDDELSIAKTICQYFNMFGITAEYSVDYEDGLKQISEKQPELILLDVNLGEKSGFDLCKNLRKNSDIPVIFISVRNTDDDILMSLGAGGDDYITKPFTMAVLLAKVKAVLKRNALLQEIEKYRPQPLIRFGDIEVERRSNSIYKEGELVKLKPLELKMLLYLYDHRGIEITKDELLEKVWGDAFICEGTLSVHVRHLREKLENDPKNPQYIKTVWGRGYIFEAE